MADGDPAASSASADRNLTTRDRLMDAGERLFAEFGFGAVSLRQIATAADQRNSSAVIYHFGGKDRLIEAIFERRQAELEPMRREMMTRVPEGSGPDAIDGLLAIVILPPLKIADVEQRYYYVKLLAAYLMRDRDSGLRHPLDYAPEQLRTLMLANERLFRILGLSRPVYDLRIQMVVGMALQAVIGRRSRSEAGLPCTPEAVVIDEVMAMANAALSAPERIYSTEPSFLI